MDTDELSCKVGTSLFNNGFSFDDYLCVGVSGGADSVCLLSAIVDFFSNDLRFSSRKKTIYVVSINHNIRSQEESLSDCEYVKTLCNSLSTKMIKIECKIVELKKGEVLNIESERKKGIEEAARYLRYKAFEEFAMSFGNLKGKAKIFFALAHNQNDQIETLIMRFLQGAGSSSKCGILNHRKINLSNNVELNYIRPLLDVNRSQIENFLINKKIQWKNDSTNLDNSYLRNRIRNLVIPLFDDNFPGWENAVLSGREKALCESSFIEKYSENYSWEKTDDGVFMQKNIFFGMDIAIRERVFFKALELIKAKKRIPYSFVKKVLFLNQKDEKFQKFGIECFIDGENLFIKNIKNKATITGFFDIIEDECTLEFDFGTLFVERSSENCDYANLRFVTNEEKVYFVNKINFPFCFRNRQLNDSVLTKDKFLKSVSDVLSDFKVAVQDKNLIPIIYSLDSKKIVVIWGELFGYQNWIVN